MLLNLLHDLRSLGCLNADVEAQLRHLFRSLDVICVQGVEIVRITLMMGERARAAEDGIQCAIDLRRWLHLTLLEAAFARGARVKACQVSHSQPAHVTLVRLS